MYNVTHNPRVLLGSQLDIRLIASPFGANATVNKERRYTIADEMTVYQTYIWIWTCGYIFGWPDAQVYAKNFFDNDIAGSLLPGLTPGMLEKHLGIHNRNHCLAIKREIDKCFPRTKENHIRVQAGMGLGEQDDYMAPFPSIRTGSVSVYNMSDSVTSTDVSLSADSEVSSIVPRRRRCLALTLRSEQKVQVGQKQDIKSKFAKLGYNVEVRFGEKANSYILEFDDEEMALKANAQFKNLGYKLTRYRPRRPSPSKPVFYRVLSRATVRVGKSFKGKIVMTLEKDDIILVDQVKGRRARVILGGERVGWVSVHSDVGYQFLERCEPGEQAHTGFITKGSH